MLGEFLPRLPDLALKAVRVFEIALVFEVLVFIIGRRIDHYLLPLIGADSGREPTYRLRRRAKLRSGPRLVLRGVLYTIALLMILGVFGVPMEPVYIGVLIIVLAGAIVLRPLLRDLCAGYIILAEDRFAPGDQIRVGDVSGVVETFSLRQTTLRDAQNAEVVHLIPNSEIGRLSARRVTPQAARPSSSSSAETRAQRSPANPSTGPVET